MFNTKTRVDYSDVEEDNFEILDNKRQKFNDESSKITKINKELEPEIPLKYTIEKVNEKQNSSYAKAMDFDSNDPMQEYVSSSIQNDVIGDLSLNFSGITIEEQIDRSFLNSSYSTKK